MTLTLLSLLLSCTPSDPVDSGSPVDTALPDADADGIPDSVEGEEDLDGDGTPNYRDDDSDGDCILDVVEAGGRGELLDSDGDGQPDYLDTDSDNNGVFDAVEAINCDAPVDSDLDGLSDVVDPDDDADTILDIEEGEADPDTDGLGNRLDSDSDGDCLGDVHEAGDADLNTPPVDSDGDGEWDVLDSDSDNDGIKDGDELACAPLDTDGDGKLDHIDPDIDGDGLSNEDEETWGTDPVVTDSDGDGFGDGLEVYANTWPDSKNSKPKGTVLTLQPREAAEVQLESLAGSAQLDVFVIIDTAYSYSCYRPNLPTAMTTLAREIFAHFDNVAVGFGTFDDYAAYASTTGNPFQLVHQISTDSTSVIASANGLSAMVYGGDAEGSAWEALYQVGTGLGFDEDCDGSISATDVAPFHAKGSDAFGGAAAGTYDASVKGTGTLGGVGWRDNSGRAIILGTDNLLRDPDDGDAVPSDTCFEAAGTASASEALAKLDAKVLAVSFYEWYASDPTVDQELTALAQATDSYIDLDGDGAIDDEALITGSWDWPSTSVLIAGLEDLLGEPPALEHSVSLTFDPENWVTEMTPTGTTGKLEFGETLKIDLELVALAPVADDDQFYQVQVQVDSEIETLETHNVWVVVEPPR